MRIGIISDVHCNLWGLKQAINGMGNVDHILCAGDLVFQYAVNNEVIEIARRLGFKCVLGNHESIVLTGGGERLRAAGTIKPENMEFLTNLPICFEEQIDGKRFYMVHGSPWDPMREYLMPNDRKIERLSEIGADIVIFGHTHFPMVKRVGNVTVINPGSCGEARDHTYGLRLTYAILDTTTGDVEIKVIEGSEEPQGWVEDTEV